MSDNGHKNEELRFKLLKVLESGKSDWTQRDIARHLGISLGRTNYCVREMVREGFVKITRFKNAENKTSYAYGLTPKGLEEQLRLLVHFLSRKLREYENLRKEIAEMNQELMKKGGLRLGIPES